MTSITDPSISDRFTSEMEEIHNKQLKAYAEINDMTIERCQSHRQLVKLALDTYLKKCKDNEMLFQAIQALKIDVEQKNTALKEKQQTISEVTYEIQQKEIQKDDIIEKIEKLKEEQVKRKQLIESQNKANKDRLRNLQKSRLVFQDHLGLEIRAVFCKTQQANGEKLQFIFRNINQSDEDSPYIITMGIKEDGSYQIVSSDPMLECLPALESRLQETNNLAAFLANCKKEFISLARC
ncbi:kinetochore protein Spc25 [Mastacembelus armatus]|uniref:Kinetochore protein SPC25 n=1 Tax=Mastacembelus armatus TaxID=205130 RepID=A0A7N9AUE6_9TELE|nr:kinetochore protein Spc25 [Mastacembelus armatus]